MIKGQESRQMSSLLTLGFLADRGLMQLSAATAPNAPDNTVWNTMDGFLEAFINQLTSPGAVPQQAHAKAFSRPVVELDWAFIASEENIPQEKQFVQWLQALRNTVGSLSRGEDVDEGQLAALRDFLDKVGRLSLAQAQSLRESTESGRRREPWPLTARI